MSIPLDRLYHHLESLCGDNIIIYRWYPHGSKKLDDLSVLSTSSARADRFKQLIDIPMICHDQEPLHYDYYTYNECLDVVNKAAELRKTVSPVAAWCYSSEFLESFAATHLRVKLDPPLNLNNYVLLCHSEKNSQELKKYEQNNFVGVYYWAHALIARDWFRYANHDSRLTPDINLIKTDFLIYNRAWSGTREYRLKFIELLIDQQLVNSCNTTFSQVDSGIHYTNHTFKNPALSIDRFDFENLLEPNNSSSNASADYETSDYTTSAIEVVLETLFDDSRNHLTEKALRPIACGKPFIIAATPGTLEYLRSYGFKTFHGLIDESYDTITDPLDRLNAIVNEMKRISNLSVDQKHKLWAALLEIAKYNKQHFFSNEMHNQVVNEFVVNLATAVEKCNQHQQGKWWKLALGLQRSEPTEFASRINSWLETHNRYDD